MRRPTIADIAQRAGVTKAAVSFALNGQPGVSAATRERILAIAAEIGFEPNSAARALVRRPGRRVRPDHRPPGAAPGQRGLLHAAHLGHPGGAGDQPCNAAVHHGRGPAEEIRIYRTWWAQRKVDGVFLVDLQVDDRRIPVLEELGMPAVVLGTPRGARTLPAVWQDVRAATEMVVGYLAGLGHQRVARVGGFTRYWHSKLRTDALAEMAGAAGIEAISVAADYTAEHGAEATRDLLKRPRRPPRSCTTTT